MKSLIPVTIVLFSCTLAFAKGNENNPVHVEIDNIPTVNIAAAPAPTVTPFTQDASTSISSGDCEIFPKSVTCYFDIPEGDQTLQIEKITGLTDMGDVLLVRFIGEKSGSNSVVSSLIPKSVFVGFTNFFEVSGPVYAFDSDEFYDSGNNKRDLIVQLDTDSSRANAVASVTIVGRLLNSAD